MNANGDLALTVLAGISIGAIGVVAIHAQEVKAPPAYLIAQGPRFRRASTRVIPARMHFSTCCSK